MHVNSFAGFGGNTGMHLCWSALLDQVLRLRWKPPGEMTALST